MLQTRLHLRTVLALIAVVLTSGVMMAPSASAKEVGHLKVGHLEGWYSPAPDRWYAGLGQSASNSQCVKVERKSSTIGWTTTHVDQTSRCGGYAFSWDISNEGGVQTTVAIWVRVASGAYAGSLVNIRNTKSECLAMRR